MITTHQRRGRQARSWVCSLLVVASACWLLPVANASAATNFTWSGAAPLGTSNWSNGVNWGGTAPSGSVGTLEFPALTSPACTANPPTDTCYHSNNDVSGLNVNALLIDDGVDYVISGNAITLGGGGITASPSAARLSSGLKIPITLGASQTWSINGGPNAFHSQGLGFSGNISGATSTLAVSFSGAFPVLAFDADVEVGPVTVTSDATHGGGVLLGYSRAPLHPASLNGTDGNPVSLSGGAGITSVKGAIGPLTLVDGFIYLGGGPGAGTLAVDGGVTFSSRSRLEALITHPGTVAGTDYSQLSATGTVSLAGASLDLYNGEGFDEEGTPCEALTPGEVDTLVTTTGSLTGTFKGVPDGTTIPVQCSPPGTSPNVKINYSAHNVTATVATAGSSPKGSKREKEQATQIATLLGREITPSGKAAKIAVLLRSGAFSTSFRALAAGTAVINWYQVPPGAKLAKKAKPKPVLVASGQRSFSAAGTAKIKIKLTAAGKRLLKHAKKLKLTAKGTFTPTGKTPITTTKVFVLKR